MITEPELTNQIYDTLMNNLDENHAKFDITNVGECEVDANNARITFTYVEQGIGKAEDRQHEFEIRINKIAVR